MIRILAIFMALSTSIPTQTISNRSWHCLTGLGAIGGAALGLFCYQALDSKDEPTPQKQTPSLKKPKKTKLATFKHYLPAIGSAALGALVSGIIARKLLWGWTPGGILEKQQALAHAQEQARIAQVNAAQGQARNHLAQAQALIHQDVRLIEFYGDNLRRERISAQERARRIFNDYPLAHAAQYMHEAEQRNINAVNLCEQALANAHNDQQIIDDCNNLIEDARANINLAQQVGAEIRGNPAYAAEVDRAAQARIAQQQADARTREVQAQELNAQAAQRQALAAEQQVHATRELARANHEKALASQEKARATDRNTAAVLQRLAHDGATLAQFAMLQTRITQLEAKTQQHQTIAYHPDNEDWEYR